MATLLVSLIVAACGAGTDDADTSLPGGTSSTTSETTIDSTTTTTPEATTSSTSTTTVSTTSSASSTTTSPERTYSPLPRAQVPGPARLDDGRPATFLAVTNDFEAVVVDTATAQVVRSLGQADDRETLDNAEAVALVAVIDGAWQTRNGDRAIISVCCEPASGLMFYMQGDETFELASPPGETSPGWVAAASPVDGTYATLGFEIRVAEEAGEIYLEDLSGTIGQGVPTFSLDGTSVLWIASVENQYFLEVLDLGGEEPDRASYPLEWVDPDGRLAGLAADASGSYVTFQTDDAFGITLAMTLSATGELLQTSEVADGSTMGAFDDSGTYLIYTDGAGVVRWIGGGGSGDLGSGYLFATW